MPTIVADVVVSIWYYDVADSGPLRQMLQPDVIAVCQME